MVTMPIDDLNYLLFEFRTNVLANKCATTLNFSNYSYIVPS